MKEQCRGCQADCQDCHRKKATMRSIRWKRKVDVDTLISLEFMSRRSVQTQKDLLSCSSLFSLGAFSSLIRVETERSLFSNQFETVFQFCSEAAERTMRKTASRTSLLFHLGRLSANESRNIFFINSSLFDTDHQGKIDCCDK